MFGNSKDYKAQVDKLEDEVEDLERQVKRRDAQISHLNGLKYDHGRNLDELARLDERERRIEVKESQEAADLKAKQDLIDTRNKAELERNASVAEALDRRTDQLDKREEAIELRKDDAVQRANSEGYTAGLKAGLDKLSELRAADAANAQELLKLHTIGAYMPKTASEDEDNPLAEAYGELGAKLVNKLVGEDE